MESVCVIAFYPMQDELVAGTSLEAIKHEEYWRQIELDSSSQRQAESSGVGPRSEMGQEALNSNSNFTTTPCSQHSRAKEDGEGIAVCSNTGNWGFK